jgi:DNA-binding FrmR family transcriptional regulator
MITPDTMIAERLSVPVPADTPRRWSGWLTRPSIVGGRRRQPGRQVRESVYRQIMHGYAQDKDAYLKRLRRIEGQVRGLQRMVEEDTYCIDVLTQISAATRALQAVAVGLLQDHLGHCVTQAIEQGGPDAEAKVKEAADAVSRLVRS